jgi:nitroimidazol reductase NimA-like FMN-containing flavoprotein (pyridoxamine 5'-phosphate oxidase superfamily)
MSRAEIDQFLQRPLVAILTTMRPDGTLHSTPVGFEYEDGKFYFWIGSNSVKAGNIRGNTEASVCIATHAEPYQYVSAYGSCEISEGDIAGRCLSICRRYYTEEAAQAFVKEDLRSGDSLILAMAPRGMLSERSA